jgi:putative endonuclease
MFYAYILKSKKDYSYYYGSTEKIQKRIKAHNSGKVKYTKGHRLWELHYSEKFNTRSEAVKREKFFKSIDGYLWLKENKIGSF